MPSSSITLHHQLQAALDSRQDRNIKRRLPDPILPESLGELLDFTSNDYLSMACNQKFRSHYLAKLASSPQILGSGGSRLLVNGPLHGALEDRLAKFYRGPSALLFNSGLDANIGFFSCVPQLGDVVVTDEYIHASVHDGIRQSRARHSHYMFEHNSIRALRKMLKDLVTENPGLQAGRNNCIIAVESLYSMDGTFAPIEEIVILVEKLFPNGNGYIVVDEAHTTGIYGNHGRGYVERLGLEDRIFARLHTFGKALGCSGAVMITTPLVKEYMINYARTMIYTTAPTNSSVIAIDSAHDLLESGYLNDVSAHLLELSKYFISQIRPKLADIPQSIATLLHHLSHPTFPPTPNVVPPSPIIAILTSEPKSLSGHLHNYRVNARPISWPTVPQGLDRVRICLHANHTKDDIDRLVKLISEWAFQTARNRRSARTRDRIASPMLQEAKL